jgi:hypothetical protein
MRDSGNLNHCQNCGGVLELVSGTDPSCGGTGYYYVDESNNRISERFSGVCAAVDYA